uniref:hypothetical protein n=1 Tax=Microbulbifer agarilyticus TaxID=260552 RepID=UPI001302F60F|nr:hypothetical protein [Microbulbifer agarilyticus]
MSSSDRASDFFSSIFMVIFFVVYTGSLPLAVIFGDKWDVVISLFVPTWGFWVMLGEVL